MRGRVAEVVGVAALATIMTVVLAAPVLRAPSERVFGMEIVGRHHDPFTVMEQFGRPITLGVYSQPVTDMTGALLSRISGAVAAYNWLVLLSFPLSAAAAYMLARHLAFSPAGAAVAAMAYAFSPFHVAHAAYHPHIAQTQWVPLYLLALWRCLDRASPIAVAFLGAATLAVTLSNFYGGLIAAVITPVAVAAYWLVTREADTRSMRRLGITVASLVLIAVAGTTYAWYAASDVVLNRTAFAFPRAALVSHSAAWWSYLVPPLAHPVLGDSSRRIFNAAGVNEGLLEQQVSLGWAIVALGVAAVFGWFAVRDRQRTPPSLACIPILVIVGLAAFVCSLPPDPTTGAGSAVRPSALLYSVVPMFRAYARFGVVVQLMAALLAGIGVEYLRRAGTRRAQIACVVLVALAAGEYAVFPPAMSRDVLPTTAHRWIVQQPDPVRALDCTPLDQESASVQWLTGHRVTLPGDSTGDCTEPNLSQRLAAHAYTHVIVRHGTAGEASLTRRGALEGLRVAASFDDAQVFAVAAPSPGVYTATMTGFFSREYHADWSWRWMGAEAAWTIVNTSARPTVVVLGIEMLAFPHARHLALRLDGHAVQTVVVDPARRTYQIGPIVVPTGDHELTFQSGEAPAVAGDVIKNGDPRPLSVAIGTWIWSVRGEQP